VFDVVVAAHAGVFKRPCSRRSAINPVPAASSVAEKQFLFFPFIALQYRFDFYNFGHEPVTRGFEAFNRFSFETQDQRAAKAFLRLEHKALGVGNISSATIPKRVERDTSQQRRAERDYHVAQTLIVCL
jgi:hypothetical protein